jgi:hypothetical protein
LRDSGLFTDAPSIPHSRALFDKLHNEKQRLASDGLTHTIFKHVSLIPYEYTEEGGSFPAHFDKRSEDVTELRTGFNGRMPLSNKTTQLVVNLEAAHRFEDEGPRTSGQMLGLFGFDLDGRNYDQTWLRGIGVEGNFTKGKGYLMLNATTEGEMPSAWMAASYQMTF